MKICDRPEFKSKKPPLTFKENDYVMTAVKAMSKDNFGSVVILNSKGKVSGIVTERDLMRKLNKIRSMISELMADEISHKKESLSSVTNLNPIHRVWGKVVTIGSELAVNISKKI